MSIGVDRPRLRFKKTLKSNRKPTRIAPRALGAGENHFGERSIDITNHRQDFAGSTIGHERVGHGGGALVLRAPIAADGPAVSALVEACPPLDPNSAYCNLLQCLHFAGTCVAAERGGALVGWISAYRPPETPEQLFVWQVAVAAPARGAGLGGRMLDELLARDAARGGTTLTATITEGNAASWALFDAFARRRGVRLARRPLFDREVHLAGLHETEHLVSIGPLVSRSNPSAQEDV